MIATAQRLAQWAHRYEPAADEIELADRSLLDTVAVALAAREDALVALSAELPSAARWAALGHVLDFDDLHMESTTHVSVICVPAALAARGDARSYLVGAGVMARLGVALGWQHYARGWHATCTAGAPAAAVTASIAKGLSTEQTAVAIALAIPAAGGVQRAFGSSGKALQVGFAVAAGLRAARLASLGATCDPAVMDQWLGLVGGDPAQIDLSGPAVPGGLAIKMFPCCYALQRPISAIREQLDPGIDPADVAEIKVRTTDSAVHPLIHHQPGTGLEGKFSLEYAVAATLLDRNPAFTSFTDAAVRRPGAQRLVNLVDTTLISGGDSLLSGMVDIDVVMRDETHHRASLRLPPGSPGRPPSKQDMAAKLAACGTDVPDLLSDLNWQRAAEILTEQLPARLPKSVPGPGEA
jgi:2-methylcitrate dehydratase PrpD